MSRRLWLIALFGLPACAVLVLVYCCFPLLVGLAGGKEAAEDSGRRDIPFVAEFDRLYPGSRHFISYYTGTHGPTGWNSKALLHRRYVLTVQCPVTLNVTRTRVVGHGNPTFVLNEIVQVQPGANGTATIKHGEQWTFGAAEWQRLVAAGGDLSVLGITLQKDAPVPHFDRAW